MKLDNYPLLKILLPYIIGIIIAYKSDFSEKIAVWLVVFMVVGVVFTVILVSSKSYRLQSILFCSFSLVFVLSGAITAFQHFKPDREPLCGARKSYVVRLDSEPSRREKSVKFEAEVLSSEDRKACCNRVVLYLRADSMSCRLAYGDIVFVNAALSEIEPPVNPDCFDNRLYMRRRGICHTGFVDAGKWHYCEHLPRSKVRQLAQNVRKRMVGVYESTGMSGAELDILKAILLGDDETLDRDLRSSYSAAGVSHILCVSGMHVGIIFMIVNFLLKPLDYFRSTRILKLVVVATVIWVYANITGLAPSVSRSATMFSFVAFGQILQRNTNVFHSLFASAFLLLFVNPLLLFEVGFQLSYLAVFGIVLFQPHLVALFKCRTKIGNYFWELLTVSLSAQIGTFPISVFYFSQFPNYFLLSNVCVITLSFAIVISGVILLPISFVPKLSGILSILLTHGIKTMNAIITTIGELPFSTTENIDYSVFQVILIYSMTLIVYFMVLNFNKLKLWFLASFSALLAISFPLKKTANMCSISFRAYHIKGCTALEFNYRGNCVIFSDSVKGNSGKLYDYNMKRHIMKHHLTTEFTEIDTAAFDNDFICKRGNLLRFNGENYLIVAKSVPFPESTPDFGIDYIIIRDNARLPPEQIIDKFVKVKIVADGSNSAFSVAKWREMCLKKSIPFIFTGDYKK